MRHGDQRPGDSGGRSGCEDLVEKRDENGEAFKGKSLRPEIALLDDLLEEIGTNELGQNMLLTGLGSRLLELCCCSSCGWLLELFLDPLALLRVDDVHELGGDGPAVIAARLGRILALRNGGDGKRLGRQVLSERVERSLQVAPAAEDVKGYLSGCFAFLVLRCRSWWSQSPCLGGHCFLASDRLRDDFAPINMLDPSAMRCTSGSKVAKRCVYKVAPPSVTPAKAAGLVSRQFAPIVEAMVGSWRRSVVLLAGLGWIGSAAATGFAGQAGAVQAPDPQAEVAAGTKTEERPLPDIPTLMHAVETNQRISEAIRKNYMFKSVQTEQDTDGHGGVKKTGTKEYEIFWVEGVPVQRMTKKDGRPLSAAEQNKQSEEIDKEVARAKEKRAKADAQGKETSPRGTRWSRSRDCWSWEAFRTLAACCGMGGIRLRWDFTGDPKAKTRNRFETVIRDLVGTVWVDEQDKVLVKAQGHFLNAFKIGGGLLVNIQKGTSFGMEQKKINDEVWLPSLLEGQGEARALLLFKFNGSLRAVESDYRSSGLLRRSFRG